MVTNTANWTSSQWESDISAAQDAHIDAFALNMAVGDAANSKALPMAFRAASDLGFKLFFSFDYAGNGPWSEDTVISLINEWSAYGGYYEHDGKPFVSTFEGPSNSDDWTKIKSETDCFFIPDWSSVGAKAAVELGTADGLFNWAAWPWGDWDMNTYTDASYLDYLDGKPYMMPASPWFYTNLPGYDKNWLWRSDHLWYDRWQEIMSIKPLPEFVQIISWNDYGESHYIGPVHENSMAAFDIGKAPYNYVLDMPHDGWRLFLPYVIDTYKNGIATVTHEGLQVWYRKAPAAACSSGGTSANTASQLQLEYTPAQVLQDKVFFSALLTLAADVTVTVGGATVPATWIKTPENDIGIHHGEASFRGHSGEVVVTIHRGGSVIAKVTGASISDSCTDGIQNYNAWVGSASSSSAVQASPGLKLDDAVCVNGTGVNNFVGLCEFACQYGYCPYSACTCEALGAQRKKPKATGVQGYPIAGEDATYSGLCSFSCNYDYCPPEACGTEKVELTVPTVSDFASPACVSGTGDGDLAGLCSYACNFGYCPISSCTCTATGALNVPKAPKTGLSGKGASGKDPLVYDGLCNFACSRGDYCPDPCVSKESSDDDGNSGSSGDGSHGGGSGDVVYVPPSLWTDDDHDALCEAPCTLILPDYPVTPTQTVTWGPVTIPLISHDSHDNAVVTTSTVITPSPFPVGYIPFYPVYVPADSANMTINPTQAIMPPSQGITLPPGVELMPTDPSYTWTTDPSPSITAGPGATSTSTTAGVVIVTFHSSSHSEDIQPTPTGTIILPKTPIPEVTVKPGKPKDSGGCGPLSTKPGCGTNFCALLGTCPGSSGGSSGGGSSNGKGSDDDDDDEPKSCSTTQTASICTEVISSYTPAGANTLTTTTDTYCVATAGCSPTGSTETITKTTSEEIHPMTVTAVDVFATVEPDSVYQSIASSIRSRQKADFTTEWATKTTSSDSRPAPTSGSDKGKLEITYYRDSSKSTGEWDVWNTSTFPLPEGILIGCPDASRVKPDAVNTKDAYPRMRDGMSFTIFGSKCTYKDTAGEHIPLEGKKAGELHCDKYRNADCTKSSGGGTCAKGDQNWSALVTCSW
ncbi:glycoside hydrolase family 71 protein [Aspergillus affinis]|uniref:glycoside hydrolase family 71 protein n=1 Tax=Aspergillus affinis TaxID=1070780 RepID=UPI0022FE6D5F|nr:carbohydrate-binding module family 24 protein [Aspergillus affinis]KAI9039615.1 carbohydrate-binding module family 24 protein [Aspergillus affinis]